MTLSLLLLFIGLSSFADQVRIDPAYLNDGVYSQETDENAPSEGVYNRELDDYAIIQVFASGGEPCTSRTPVGGACLCNGFVLSRTERPYHVRVHPFLFIKANWHLTNLKGRHAGGRLCCPLPCSTRSTMRWRSIASGFRRVASEIRRPAA